MREAEMLEVDLLYEVRPGDDLDEAAVQMIPDPSLKAVGAVVVVDQDVLDPDGLVEGQPLPDVEPFVAKHRRDRQIVFRRVSEASPAVAGGNDSLGEKRVAVVLSLASPEEASNK